MLPWLPLLISSRLQSFRSLWKCMQYIAMLQRKDGWIR